MKKKLIYSILLCVALFFSSTVLAYADGTSYYNTNIGYGNVIVEQGTVNGQHSWRAARYEYSSFPSQAMSQVGATVWTTYVKFGTNPTLYSYDQYESYNNPGMIQSGVKSYNGDWLLKYDVTCPPGKPLTRYNYVNHYWQSYGGTYRNAEKWQISTLQWPTFYDVPTNHWAYSYIEPMIQMGIMDPSAIRSPECPTDGFFCPTSNVTRAEMAFFLERGIRGSNYAFPNANGYIFDDVPLSYQWPSSNIVGAVIEKLYSDGITGGCATNPLRYCPEGNVTRAQMAVFLLRAEHGSNYQPPSVSSTIFSDVPGNYWAAPWIQQLSNEGITSGCSATEYCPDRSITRAEMAIFLLRAFTNP
ncbi:MAG: S-layer homology domain-containing protein [Chloroflexi bacterium]|nr:S-layer homology domain-containing protein [Chloroflexota bacterium]